MRKLSDEEVKVLKSLGLEDNIETRVEYFFRKEKVTKLKSKVSPHRNRGTRFNYRTTQEKLSVAFDNPKLNIAKAAKAIDELQYKGWVPVKTLVKDITSRSSLNYKQAQSTVTHLYDKGLLERRNPTSR